MHCFLTQECNQIQNIKGINMNENVILSVKNLKTFFFTDKNAPPIKAVDGIDLEIKKGKITTIVGESGSGKSVTSLSIMGLVSNPGKVVSGEIILNGKAVHEYNDKQMQKVRGKDISMIFQDPASALNPIVKIKKQLLEAIFIHMKMTKKEALGKCRKMIESVGLDNPDKILDSYPFELSGGMCQRVMVAMALLCEPLLLIADEPTSSLDLTVQASVLNLLMKLKNEGMSILLITHDLGVVAQMSDYVYVIKRGKIVEKGDVYEVFENPQHEYTKALLTSNR